MPRIRDVAAHAEVDPSVVSRVINRDPNLVIRPETRQRVLNAIAALEYKPNAAARSLRTARADTYGLMIPDFANPVYAEIIKGAELAALKTGRLLLTGSSSTPPDLVSGAYVSELGEGRVDGLLLAGNQATGKILDVLTQRRLPWMLLNRQSSRQPARFVALDDEQAAGIAVDHLVQLGHVRIGHVAGPPSAGTARMRRRGYLKALRRAGLPFDEELLVRGDYTPHDGARAMGELLALDRRPTAVFVGNVTSAIGALDTVRRSGLSVPGDVSVIAIHDFEIAAFLSPPLTTVRMPLAELGRRGVELLASTDPNAPVREVVRGPMELVLRDSTAPPGPRSRRAARPRRRPTPDR